MSWSGLAVQLLNGLASASTLFLLASGLSLIFGVTRIVNFAHGSLFMLGAYIAWTLTGRLSGAFGFWGAMAASAVVTGIIGALIELVLLRRIYRSPELLQLLATFALTLIARDAVLNIWGSEDLMGPRAPGLSGSVLILGRHFPQYDLLLIATGPVILGLVWLLMSRTRWGAYVRAATQDREMVSALGVNQSMLFTSVFALGAALAGLGGALQLPLEPASTGLDLTAISDAFVVVVVGGMGSLPGAYVAALLISEIKALCVGLGQWTLPFGVVVSFPHFTLIAEFLVMALVLVVRPWGLLGRPQAPVRSSAPPDRPLIPANRTGRLLALAVVAAVALLPLLTGANSYTVILAIDIFISILFAVSLHFIMGPGGLGSFGHAAYFGLGAYTAALVLKTAGLPMEAALLLSPLGGAAGALLAGWFCVRLTGVYFAMLTLAFGQIVWSIAYQWDDVTGGSNGVIGVWPAHWLDSKIAYYYLALTSCVAGILLLRRILFSPFGYALRAGRDSVLRAESIGIDIKAIQWTAFVIAGAVCGFSGGLFAFSKGSISPETAGVARSFDGLVMVLLGGVQTLAGPVVGAASFVFLQDYISQNADYWRAVLGGFILVLVIAFPDGIAGALRKRSGDL